MIVLDLSILNQKGTPMFNSDTFANRPAFGIVGRIFISIDTAAIYRDTGTAWDLIADGGSASTNIYNSNGTLTGNRVLSDGGFGLSFTPTTHIGTASIGGGGNGKLIVGSSTADNGIQVFGATAPSIRIDNAQSGGTQRFVIGLATATNNFIQGAIAGDFCITTASVAPLLFGMWQTTNASEVMRISTANNLIVGSTTDNGNRLQITGTGYFSGNLGVGVITAQFKLDITANSNSSIAIGQSSDDPFIWFDRSDGGSNRLAWRIRENASRSLIFETGSSINKYGQTFTSAFFLANTGDATFLQSVTSKYYAADNGATGGSSQLLYRLAASSGSNFGQIGNTGTRWSLGYGPSATSLGTEVLCWNSSSNVLIGTTTDAGQKFQVNGTGIFSGNLNLASAGDNLSLSRTSFTTWNFGVGTVSGISGLHIGTSATYISLDQTTGEVTFNSFIKINNPVNSSVVNTVTNKVAIIIGGVQYYLLASTSSV